MRIDDAVRSKLDQRLVDEIAKQAEHGTAAPSDAFSVTIELAVDLKPRRGLSRTDTLADLRDQATDLHAGIEAALAEAGTTHYQRHVLSNSIEATLSAPIILTIADRPDVQKIRLVKLDRVTTEHRESRPPPGGGPMFDVRIQNRPDP